MKNITLLFMMAAITTLSKNLNAQGNCRVLMVPISGTYNGNCKDGLADGKGEASGTDRYVGDFKKGYPNGRGTYFWHTGEKYTGEWKKGLRDGKGTLTFKYMNRDSVISGLWKDDKYIGEKEVDPFVVEYRDGVGRVVILRVGDRPYVQLKFSRNGTGANEITNLLMQASSGSERNEASFTGFEQVDFPFKCKVRFNAPNAFYAAFINCEVRFTINKPGAWIVSLYY